MSEKVFLIQVSAKENLEEIHKKIYTLYERAGFDLCFEPDETIAIKTHFGEAGNTTHIPANYFLPVIDNLKKNGGKPFFTDTCVLYESVRSDAISHLHLAEQHGFTIKKTGAPVIIADGLRGRNETIHRPTI